MAILNKTNISHTIESHLLSQYMVGDDLIREPQIKGNSLLLDYTGALYQLPIDRKKYLIIKGNFERSFYKYIDDRDGAQTLKKEHFKLLIDDIYVWQYS